MRTFKIAEILLRSFKFQFNLIIDFYAKILFVHVFKDEFIIPKSTKLRNEKIVSSL